MITPLFSKSFRFGRPVSQDPYAAYVTNLLHFDGVNGSTTFIDEVPKTWSAFGTVSLSTTRSMFGPSSLSLGGSASDYINTSSGNTFNGDFTVECWVYPTANSVFANLLSLGDESANRLALSIDGGVLKYDIFAGSLEPIIGGNVPLNQWTHIAYSRQGSSLRGFVGGVLVGTVNQGGTLGNANGMSIGQRFNGWVDEFRITKGVARYTNTFIPPTSVFPNP